jgi:hypothetical protein
MKKSILSAKQKSVGRPATGITPMMGFRAEPVTRAAIVRWAEKQPDMPTLSEAIRRLVELGLTVPSARAPLPKATLAPPKTGRLSRARELAAEAIEKMDDPAASIDERDERRRRLTKGPPEFRDHRVDLPKATGE